MKTKEQAANAYVYDNFYQDTVWAQETKDAFLAGVEFAQQWISVEEELPESGKTVLIKDKNNMIGLACIRLGVWDYKFKNMITHWRPITKN